jgi:hypothetical protein
MVNNLRTDKAQVLGGLETRTAVTVHETRIVMASLADFGCVCA